MDHVTFDGAMLSNVPADGTVVRRRLGNRVRIQLARPWFANGDGERLAVVVALDGADASLLDLVTEGGRDPVWDTGEMTPFPAPEGERVVVPLAEVGSATVVAHWGVRGHLVRRRRLSRHRVV
jgi:hypothetical protein